MKREDIEKRSEELIIPIIEANGFELVDLEYVKEGGNYFLRAFVDKEGGITIDDCELVSRAFSELLDKEDYIEESYVMEISSPGLGRPLKKEKDFKRSMGQAVEVKTYVMKEFPFYRRKSKDFTGKLTGYADGNVTVTDEEENVLEFAKSEIALVRLAVEW